VILIAVRRGSDVMAGMGAKYQPTIRDLKATERFHKKQVSRPMLTKASSDRAISAAVAARDKTAGDKQ
jgi:hypothetical protein